MDNEMPCFDPKNVLFITNKWDAIKTKKPENDSESSDEEDEEEEEKVWEDLLYEIKEKWPSVKGDHIFKMSLQEVITISDTSYFLHIRFFISDNE